MTPICWDGSPLTVRDIQKAMPGVVSEFFYHDGVLYVKTRDNAHTPVPTGWYVSSAGEGFAQISEES